MSLQSKPTQKNICAVVVSHDPPPTLLLNIKSTAQQVDKVVIVNSGPKKINPNFFAREGLEEKVHLIRNFEDLGQGRDLNCGINWAISQGYQWVLLMDQDSLPVSSMVEELIKAYEACLCRDEVKLVGSNCTYKIGEIKYKKECRGKLYFEREVMMTTGSLLSVDAYKATGPFRKEFFIDSIDADYSLRLRDKGFHLIVACKAQMSHSIGDMTPQRFFGRVGFVTNHNHIRCYYMIRNMTVLLKEYIFKEPYWVFRNIIWLFFVKPSCVIIYEKDKAKKLKEMIKGFFHGLIGKLGKYQ